MRIAVCFNGQIRTGIEASTNILNYVNNDLYHIDFFIHTWNIETISRWGLGGRDVSVANVQTIVDDAKIDKFREIYRPKRMVVDDYNVYIRDRSGNLGGSYSAVPLFHSNYEVNKLRKEYEEEHNIKYDFVLRVRPDVLFDVNENLINELRYIGDNNMSHTQTSGCLYVNDTWNVYPNAIDDMCWLATPLVMDLDSKFVLERESDTTNIPLRSLDWQIHHKMYLDNNNIRSRPFRHNSLCVYRDYHVNLKISPMDINEVLNSTSW